MWIKSYSIVTKDVTKEQMWKLFSDVNNWHTWDKGIEYASMQGPFAKGNHFTLKPKGAPKVSIELIETIENQKFIDLTRFPLAKMYDEHTFEETKEGLRITNTLKVKGLLGFVWRKIVAQNIVNGWPKEVENQIKSAKTL